MVAVVVTGSSSSSKIICLDRSPGFGITLAAETTGGSLLCAEACSRPYGSTEERVSADDVGAKAAFNLLAEIYQVSLASVFPFYGRPA